MKTIFYEDYTSSEAYINPWETVKPQEHFPQVCISTFSKQIVEQVASMDKAKAIAYLYTANGANPVYQITYSGCEFTFYLSQVGAPACVCGLEEMIALGAKKFVFFGCCGMLDEEQAGGKIIVPTAAVRDEGTSYHYMAPSEELTPAPEATRILKTCLDRRGYPYVCGKIWTTDAIYRETLKAIDERKKAGCIAVEMEFSALAAAAAYRKVPFIQFLYGADSLEGETWQPRDLTDYGLNGAEKYMALALECALELSSQM